MHEEQPRLLVEHVAVERRHLDPVRALRLDHGIDLFFGEHEVAGDGGLAAAGGLEADCGGHAQRAGRHQLHSALGDRIAARHAELIDAAVGLPLHADDLIELGGVEIDRGLRGWRRWGRQRSLARRQAGADGGGELHRIAMPADVHVVRRGIAAQHVIVDRGDLDAVFDQFGHDRIDLGIEQHEVAHDHDPAVGRLECRPAAERQGGPNSDAIERHVKVAARKAVAVHVARHGGAPPQRLIDFLPVDLLRLGGAADCRHGANRKHVSSTHDDVLLS